MQPPHALSIDVEDWYNVALLAHRGDVVRPTEAVLENTQKLLRLLSEHQVRATWFVLGEVAETYPGLVAEIAAEGHELGVHGFHHHLVHQMSLDQFRDAVVRARAAVEAAAGSRCHGYRAAAFSLSYRQAGAYEVLAEAGYTYDSSLFPFRGRRYGEPRAAMSPHTIPTRRGLLLEVPLTVLEFGPFRLPCCGGGYFRHFPLAYTRLALRSLERCGRQAVFYLHPYELDTTFNASFWRRHFPAGHRCELYPARLLQYRNRWRTTAKLRRVLREFAFGPICEVIGTVRQAINQGRQSD